MTTISPFVDLAAGAVLHIEEFGPTIPKPPDMTGLIPATEMRR